MSGWGRGGAGAVRVGLPRGARGKARGCCSRAAARSASRGRRRARKARLPFGSVRAHWAAESGVKPTTACAKVYSRSAEQEPSSLGKQNKVNSKSIKRVYSAGSIRGAGCPGAPVGQPLGPRTVRLLTERPHPAGTGARGAVLSLRGSQEAPGCGKSPTSKPHLEALFVLQLLQPHVGGCGEHPAGACCRGRLRGGGAAGEGQLLHSRTLQARAAFEQQPREKRQRLSWI